jgi:outer membrane translocation and assembly module TamA
LRLGAADLEPNARLDVSRESLERKVTLGLFNELAPIDEQARHLGVANSLLAAAVGRDDGDYYRRSGAWFELRPPTAAPQTFGLRAFAEYHRSAVAQTDFAIAWLGDEGRAFRPNLASDEGWEYGLLAELRPWWGSDPNRVQGGFDVSLRAAGGDFRYVRASALAGLGIPLPADFGFDVEAAVGTSWDSPSIQRQFYLGGPSTLRGYAPRRLAGRSFGRARAELGRQVPLGTVSVFSELGWAGARDQIAFDDALYSVGTGIAILDGMIRVDAAWGLRDPTSFRLDLYLDAIR